MLSESEFEMKKLTPLALDGMIRQHQRWLQTSGRQGTRAVFKNICFRDSNLSGADLRGAEFLVSSLGGANLQGVDFRDCSFVNMSFNESDLRGADLRGACLRGTNFTFADLRGADLRGADLHRAELRMSDLRGAKLDVGFRDCFTFWNVRFTPDALPWIILHPHWALTKDSITLHPSEECAA